MQDVNNSSPPRQQWCCRWPDTKPSQRERAFLSLLGKHDGLLLAHFGGAWHFNCGDGSPARCGGFRAFTFRDFEKFVELGWLQADPAAPGLFEDSLAQRYQATPAWGSRSPDRRRYPNHRNFLAPAGTVAPSGNTPPLDDLWRGGENDAD